MENYLKQRPPKKIFTEDLIQSLRDKAIKKIKTTLLPDEKIIRIILIGSSVKNTFGKYEPPGFRGSLFSDFDFIVFIEDDYKIPKWLKSNPEGKPFSDNTMNLAYRNEKVIDHKYDVELFFLKHKHINKIEIQEEAEGAGIPLSPHSKHKYISIYEKETS